VHLSRAVATLCVSSNLFKYLWLAEYIPSIKFSILEEQVNAEGILELSVAAKPLMKAEQASRW
jgi:hypothetical protein